MGDCSLLTKEEKQAIKSFKLSKNLPLEIAVTFEDVTITEKESSIRSREEIIDAFVRFQGLKSEVVPGFTINLPVVSANMESVTGVEMIAALQRLGGLGIPPQTLPPVERLKILKQVAQEDCAYRKNPLTIRPYQTLKEVKETANTYGIRGFIVVNDEDQPVGILSSRDWLHESLETKQVKDMMGGGRLKRLVTAPKGIALEEAARILAEQRIEKLPLVDSEGKLAGAIFAKGLFYKNYYPNATRNKLGQFVRVASIGVGRKFTPEHLRFIEKSQDLGAEILLIDTARAYSINTKEAITKTKQEFPDLPIICGNVSTPEGAKALIEWGADCVKIGQGPGEACRTREVGIGVPQLTAIAECSTICHLYGKKAMADGGMHSPGDIAKALLAGADTVMLGFMLAGTMESAAPAYYNEEGLKVKDYEGSASFRAQRKRQTRGDLRSIRRPEGINKQVYVRGSINEVINDILWGLASTFSYVDAKTLEEFREKAKFLWQTRSGFIEGSKRS